MTLQGLKLNNFIIVPTEFIELRFFPPGSPKWIIRIPIRFMSPKRTSPEFAPLPFNNRVAR